MLETLSLGLHVTRRNWLVYRRDFLANVAPTMVEPYVMMLSLGIGVGSYVAQVQGRSYIAFLAPGLVISAALFTAFFESSYGFFVRLKFENIYQAMLTTPIGPKEVIVGEFVWVSLKGAMMTGLLAATMAAAGLMQNPLNWIFLPLLGALVALPCGALGLLAASFMRNINQFQSIYAFFISPLFFFSGIFFPLEQMPEILQWVAKSLPLYHGARLCQMFFWNEINLSSVFAHVSALVLFSLVLGSWAFMRTRRLLGDY